MPAAAAVVVVAATVLSVPSELPGVDAAVYSPVLSGQLRRRPLALALAGLLLFVPLFRAANRPLPLMLAELAALVVAAYWLFYLRGFLRLDPALRIALAALLAYPLLYLLPLPFAWWSALPGRADYATTLMLLEYHGSHAASLLAAQTELAWLALLPPLTVFAAVLLLDVARVRKLLLLFLGVAVGEACLGLLQYGDGPDSILRLGGLQTPSAVGTYVNRNHLAGLLEMALPVALALLAATVGRGRAQLSYTRNLKEKSLEFINRYSHHALVHALAASLLLLGLVFTQSRTGVALGMVAIALSVFAYARRLGGSNVFGMVGSVVAAAIGLALLAGLAPVLQRFTEDPLVDARWEIFSSSLRGVGQFFPVGSGPGTYPYVFVHFQDKITEFVNHAHNDYIEWLFEGGLLAALLLAYGFFLYLRQWPRLWEKGRWSQFRFMQIGAGIGAGVLLLHGLTDFNLHIPANSLYCAFLLAVFLHPADEVDAPVRPAAGPTLPISAGTLPPSSLPVFDPAQSPRNPFLDE